MNNIGVHNVKNIDALLDSHAIWPFTHVVGALVPLVDHVMLANNKQNRLAATGAWSKEQVSWLTASAKQEARDVSLKLYIELSVQSSFRCLNVDSHYKVRCLGSQELEVVPPSHGTTAYIGV